MGLIGYQIFIERGLLWLRLLCKEWLIEILEFQEELQELLPDIEIGCVMLLEENLGADKVVDDGEFSFI